MTMKIWLVSLVVLAIATLLMGGWYYFGVVNGSNNGSGSLKVLVHDAPCGECSHVWVSFSSAAVRESDSSGSGWTSLAVSGSSMDLMTMNGSAFARAIGLVSVKVGHYDQVGLTLRSVQVTLLNGTNMTAAFPGSSSAEANGAFDIQSGLTTTLSIDIDLSSSVQIGTNQSGVYATCTPVIGSVAVS